MKFSIYNKILFYLIPFFIGFIISFSLPPYNYLILNFIFFPILFIFFLSDYNSNKWKSFKIGWLFGFGYFLSNIYWITNSLTFDHQFKNLILFALIIIPLFLGLFYGLITFFCSLINLRLNFSSILIFSTVFSSVEFLRGFIMGGFPWNLHAYSWSEYINFLQILSFTGTYAFNLLSITLFMSPLFFFIKNNLQTKIILIISIIVFITTNFYYGSTVIAKYNQNSDIKINSTLKIISPKIKIDRFFINEEPSELIKELIILSDPSSKKDTIFIFPEGMLTSISLKNLKVYKELFSNNYSQNHKIILGINSEKNSKIFNSLIVIDNNANVLDEYNKNNLVPFGEFLPFENLFSKFGINKIIAGYQSYSGDNERKILNINNIRFLPLICYEIIYSGELNKSDEDFDFIINISEDGWFGNSIGPYQHFSHSIFRSIEEGKNLIRSTNNGITAYINSVGQTLERIESTEKGVIEVENYKKLNKTLFSIHGNKIFLYFLLFYITLIFFLRKKEIK